MRIPAIRLSILLASLAPLLLGAQVTDWPHRSRRERPAILLTQITPANVGSLQIAGRSYRYRHHGDAHRRGRQYASCRPGNHSHSAGTVAWRFTTPGTSPAGVAYWPATKTPARSASTGRRMLALSAKAARPRKLGVRPGSLSVRSEVETASHCSRRRRSLGHHHHRRERRRAGAELRLYGDIRGWMRARERPLVFPPSGRRPGVRIPGSDS
jgi:hypothetical protein